jgi:hypothetical protein
MGGSWSSTGPRQRASVDPRNNLKQKWAEDMSLVPCKCETEFKTQQCKERKKERNEKKKKGRFKYSSSLSK